MDVPPKNILKPSLLLLPLPMLAADETNGVTTPRSSLYGEDILQSFQQKKAALLQALEAKKNVS